jgi:DNA-binding NarL/FixJ family response regulator
MATPAVGTPTPSPLRVILVDTRDDRRSVTRQLVERVATATVVAEANSRAEAVVQVGREGADAVVVDVRMPIAEGLATIAELRRSSASLGIVVCSFDLDQGTAERALAEGADVCLAKPVRPEDVRVAFEGLAPRGRGGSGPVPAVASSPAAPAMASR